MFLLLLVAFFKIIGILNAKNTINILCVILPLSVTFIFLIVRLFTYSGLKERLKFTGRLLNVINSSLLNK